METRYESRGGYNAQSMTEVNALKFAFQRQCCAVRAMYTYFMYDVEGRRSGTVPPPRPLIVSAA